MADDMTRMIDVRLPADPASVPAARRLIQDLGDELPRSRLQDVMLMVSELVTNSVRHAGLAPDQRIHLTLERSPVTVRVTVSDPGRGFGRQQGRVADSNSGWGLELVRHLAERWGHDAELGYSRVWFETPTGGDAQDQARR